MTTKAEASVVRAAVAWYEQQGWPVSAGHVQPLPGERPLARAVKAYLASESTEAKRGRNGKR